MIDAEEGRIAGAAKIWRDLSRDAPDYEPSRRNLVSLRGSQESSYPVASDPVGEGRDGLLPRAATIKSSRIECPSVGASQKACWTKVQ